MARPNSKFIDGQLELVPGIKVPLRLYLDQKSRYRATVGKKYIIFRIGHRVYTEEIIQNLEKWARDLYQKQPQAFAHLLPVGVPTEGRIMVMDKGYDVRLEFSEAYKSHRGVADPRKSNSLILQLTPNDKRPTATIVNTLLSRLFSQRYHAELWQRLQALNQAHFQVKIEGLRLKYTQTRWGSCSSKGNINLSSRLLMAPAKTRDAVMVHEIAHRLEMNHGPKFWNHVYNAMEDYDEHHLWLKDHGASLRFLPY